MSPEQYNNTPDNHKLQSASEDDTALDSVLSAYGKAHSKLHSTDSVSDDAETNDLWASIDAQLTEDTSASIDIAMFDEEWINSYFDNEIVAEDPAKAKFEAQLNQNSKHLQQLSDLDSLSTLLYQYHLTVERRVDALNLCPDSIADNVMAAYDSEQGLAGLWNNVKMFPKRLNPVIGTVAAAVLLLVVAINTGIFNEPLTASVAPVQEEFLMASSVSNHDVPSADEYFIQYCNTDVPAEQDSMAVLYTCFTDAI